MAGKGQGDQEDAAQKAAQTTPSTEAPATAGEPPESAIAELTPGRSAEPEAALEEQRTQIALFGTAKVTAVYAGHDVEGVRVDRVDPTSFWGLVGVRSGDTVIAHNGAPIDDAAAMVGLLNAMEGDAVIRLRVRGAQGDAERAGLSLQIKRGEAEDPEPEADA